MSLSTSILCEENPTVICMLEIYLLDGIEEGIVACLSIAAGRNIGEDTTRGEKRKESR